MRSSSGGAAGVVSRIAANKSVQGMLAPATRTSTIRSTRSRLCSLNERGTKVECHARSTSCLGTGEEMQVCAFLQHAAHLLRRYPRAAGAVCPCLAASLATHHSSSRCSAHATLARASQALPRPDCCGTTTQARQDCRIWCCSHAQRHPHAFEFAKSLGSSCLDCSAANA